MCCIFYKDPKCHICCSCSPEDALATLPGWFPCSFPSSSAVLFYFTCPAASCSGEAPEWTKHQRLFVHQCQTTHFHSSLSLSVYLLHSPSMSMSLFPVSSFQQCFTSEPQPTQQIPLRGTSPFYLAHSLSRTPGRFCLTPLVFICHFLINATSVFHSESVTPPNTHVAVTSSGGSCCSQGHRSKVLVGRPIISATVSGTPAWDLWRTSPTSASHLATESFKMCICEIHLSVLSAVGMSTCVVWEMKWWDCSRPLSTRPPKYWQTGSAFLSHCLSTPLSQVQGCEWKITALY